MTTSNPPGDTTSDALPHKPADDSEQVYFEGSPLLRGQVASTAAWEIIGLLMIVAPLAWRIFNGAWPAAWVTLILILLGLLLWAVPLIRVKSQRYRVTNYRIDFERGLLSKTIDTLELWHVEDIRFHQSLLERILGVGSITVLSHDDTTPKLELRGLPNPRPLFDQLKQRVIAVKRQRGVIKMDTGN